MGRGLSLASLFDALPETRVTAISDRIDRRLSEAGRAIPSAAQCAEFEDMLTHQPDIVVVASSPAQHADHVCAALEAGAAVLSEVPAADSVEGAQRIVDTVERTGGFYMLGENCNYYGFIRSWKGLLDTGVLGDPVHAEGEYVHDIRHITWMDRDGRMTAPRTDTAVGDTTPTWRAAYHPILYVTHSLGPLLWLTGERCTSVSCLSTGVRTDPEVGSPDMEVAILNTSGGVPIRQLVGFSVPSAPGGQWFSLYGTKGHVEWKRCGWDSGRVYVDGQEVKDCLEADWDASPGLGPLADSGHGGIDGAMVWDFVQALSAGDASPIGVHAAMDYTLPGMYARTSAELGGQLLRIPDSRTERLA